MMRMTPQKLCTFLFKLTVSIALAFPLSGLTLSLIALIRDPHALVIHPLGAIVESIIFDTLWFGIGSVTTGGFPIADEAGINRVNMYPYIALTAFIIFFLLSKGWRWFRNRTTHPN
jgi:hypothetical protein